MTALDDQVEAILAGREGCVLDFYDKATLFGDINGAVPITADGQSVARAQSKWGTIPLVFNTSVTTRWPLSAEDGIVYDGVDDVLLGVAGNLGFMNDAPFITAGVAFTPADVTRANGTLFYFSRNGSSTQNWLDIMMATSGLRFLTRRTQLDATTAITSAAGTIANGVPAVGLMEADFAGTGRLEARLNGVQLPGANLNGTIGNTEAANSNATTLGAVSTTVSRIFGTLTRIFLARFALTPSERDTVEAWLAERPAAYGLNFPASPAPGETYTAEGTTFLWTGSVWVVPPAGLFFATQAEAEAGERWDRGMSPLNGDQAIDALYPAPPPVTPPEAVCIAMCIFNGVTGAIIAEKNVASVSGANTGRYGLTFRDPPPDLNNVVFGTAQGVTNHPVVAVAQDSPATTTPGVMVIQVGTTGGNLTTQGGFLVASALIHVGVFRYEP